MLHCHWEGHGRLCRAAHARARPVCRGLTCCRPHATMRIRPAVSGLMRRPHQYGTLTRFCPIHAVVIAPYRTLRYCKRLRHSGKQRCGRHQCPARRPCPQTRDSPIIYLKHPPCPAATAHVQLQSHACAMLPYLEHTTPKPTLANRLNLSHPHTSRNLHYTKQTRRPQTILCTKADGNRSFKPTTRRAPLLARTCPFHASCGAPGAVSTVLSMRRTVPRSRAGKCAATASSTGCAANSAMGPRFSAWSSST